MTTTIVSKYLCKQHIKAALRLCDAYNTGFCLWDRVLGEDMLIAKAIIANRTVISVLAVDACMCCNSHYDLTEIWVMGNVDALALQLHINMDIINAVACIPA